MESIILKKAAAAVLIVTGILFFLVEYKALPNKPKNPEKWDNLHARYFRAIKMTGRICLLLGLTFMLT